MLFSSCKGTTILDNNQLWWPESVTTIAVCAILVLDELTILSDPIIIHRVTLNPANRHAAEFATD